MEDNMTLHSALRRLSISRKLVRAPMKWITENFKNATVDSIFSSVLAQYEPAS